MAKFSVKRIRKGFKIDIDGLHVGQEKVDALVAHITIADHDVF